MHADELARRLPIHAHLLEMALEHYRSRSVEGLFLGGSLATGEADRFSDIDLHILATDDAYPVLLAERPDFMRSLGPVICEWSTYGEGHLLCLYETGVVLEVILHRSDFLTRPRPQMKVRILHDPTGQLAAYQARCEGLANDPEVPPEKLPLLWQQVWAWLWRGVGQTLRGEVWEGRDYLEFLRDRAVMPLYRTLKHRRAEGYRRLEGWAEPAFLDRLAETVAPPDTGAVLQSLLATTALIEELCQELAVEYGLSLPPEPTRAGEMARKAIREHLGERLGSGA